MESTAVLHDGTALTVTAAGTGPAVLLPVRTRPYEPEAAENMRRWGADPDIGPVLAEGLAAAGFRTVTADYEAHRMAHPAPGTLTPAAVAADLLAVADAAGADRFAYYGYSWLALSGLQLALRTDRLWALAMGGYPPADGPYAEMLTVTRAAHEKAAEPRPAVSAPVTPGDWDAADVGADTAQTRQFVTLYEALRDFDDVTAQRTLTVARLAFAGTEDAITYGPSWGDTVVRIGEPLVRRREQLTSDGWSVTLLEGLDHMSAMHGATVLPLLSDWLTRHRPACSPTPNR